MKLYLLLILLAFKAMTLCGQETVTMPLRYGLYGNPLHLSNKGIMAGIGVAKPISLKWVTGLELNYIYLSNFERRGAYASGVHAQPQLHFYPRSYTNHRNFLIGFAIPALAYRLHREQWVSHNNINGPVSFGYSQLERVRASLFQTGLAIQTGTHGNLFSGKVMAQVKISLGVLYGFVSGDEERPFNNNNILSELVGLNVLLDQGKGFSFYSALTLSVGINKWKPGFTLPKRQGIPRPGSRDRELEI